MEEAAGPGYPRGVKLGVDVGMVRVGLAASDRDGIIATPVATLKRDSKGKRDIRIIMAESAQREAVEVFVGLPRSLNGGETASTQMAREYAAEVAAALRDAGQVANVRLIDERLSTVSAHRSLREAGLKTTEHRKLVDQVAAVEILQHAIDMQRSLGRDVGDPVAARQRNREKAGSLTPMEEPVISETTISVREHEL